MPRGTALRGSHGDRRGRSGPARHQARYPGTTSGSRRRMPRASSWPAGAWAFAAEARWGWRSAAARQSMAGQWQDHSPWSNRSRHPRRFGNPATGSRGCSAGIAGRPSLRLARSRNATGSRFGRIGGWHRPGPVSAAVPSRWRRRRPAPRLPGADMGGFDIASWTRSPSEVTSLPATVCGGNHWPLNHRRAPAKSGASGGHLEDATDID